MGRTPVAGEAFERFLARLEAGTAGPQDSGGERDGESAPGPEIPDWPVQLIAALYDGQGADDAARDWARRVHGGLQALEGRAPLAVVHDWHVRTVSPMLAGASELRGGTGAEQRAAGALHARALKGEKVTEAEWSAALGPALREAYRYAYAYAEAFTTAAVNARAYAKDIGKSDEQADEFADYYAELNTSANARSYADANALANARALAAAYATADARAYAETYPSAYAHAVALAHANRDETEGQDERRRSAYRRLAEGLADSLARAAA